MTLESLLADGISVDDIKRDDGEVLYFIPLTLLAKDGKFNPSLYSGHGSLLHGVTLDIDEFDTCEEDREEIAETIGNMIGWLHQADMTGEMGIPIINYRDEQSILVRWVEADNAEGWESAYLLMIANAAVENGQVVYKPGELLEWNQDDLAGLGIGIETESESEGSDIVEA